MNTCVSSYIFHSYYEQWLPNGQENPGFTQRRLVAQFFKLQFTPLLK